jgi:asparagine synthase (glutamine-hydrolysing)
MCGITGLWCAHPVAENTAHQWIQEMTATLVHRGPDGSGTFFDPDAGIGFGHRRLSILDLSDAGHQPMWSQSGRYCIAYNGEVYNAPEIRADLDRKGLGVAWRGHSDTEVVLETIEALGLERAVPVFQGMFAFALWDRHRRQLSLVRDRLGIKPLVYIRGSFGIAFASELQALYELPLFQPKLDRGAVAAFLRYGVVPGAQCIIEGARKLPPGMTIVFDEPLSNGRQDAFWSAEEVARRGLSHPFEGSETEAIDELERRICQSVKLRMRSDVPFGAFLSGGIDSSTVVAMMQQSSPTPVKTFCIGNALAGYDESREARAVAEHLGCEHHTLIASPSDMIELVPNLAGYYDEPFADSSQIPTFMVSHLTRKHVTVSLSGDGGDELFAGYNRHAWAPRLWKLADRLPRAARKAFGVLKLVAVDDWDRAFRAVGLEDALRLPGDKLHKIAALAEVGTAHEFYARLRSHWVDPEAVVVGRPVEGHPAARTPEGIEHFDCPFPARMMLDDLVEYLPDDILTKVDRASMAVSLEARVPLLDHELVEFAWRLPLRWKIRNRTQKWILRQVLARHVPTALFERPKMGFGVPVGQWLRGPLRNWAAELLDQDALRIDGILHPRVVRDTWDAHLAGRGNHEHRLWAVLMFQSWWRLNRHRIAA